MGLAIVMPAYNEEKRILKTLKEIKSNIATLIKKLHTNINIYICNDGSTDNTEKFLKDFLKRNNNNKKIKGILKSDLTITPLGYKHNRGKGFCLRYALAKIQADYYYMADIDLSAPINEINKFWSLRDKADIIIGSRYHTKISDSSIIRRIMSNISSFIIQKTLNLEIKDTQCGFKLFNNRAKEIFLRCTNNRWGFDFEFLYLAQKAGLKILELPINWQHTPGSKVKAIDYIRTFKELIHVKLHRYD